MGLDRSTYLEERYGAEVTWLPFFLHPEIPPGGLPSERLWGAAVTPDMRERYLGRLRGLAEDVGLPFRAPGHLPRTLPTLQASEWVRRAEPDHFDTFHRAVFLAYWGHGRDIEAPDVLADLAADAGLDPNGVVAATRDETLTAAVLEERDEAVRLGVTGTPAWLLEGRMLVAGAQPRESFDRTIAQLRRLDPADDAPNAGGS